MYKAPNIRSPASSECPHYQLLILNSKLFIDYRESVDMLVDVVSHLAGPLLLVLDEEVVVVVKLRVFLVESHEVLVAHVLLHLRRRLLVGKVSLVDELAQFD